jgi:hypothetical protein
MRNYLILIICLIWNGCYAQNKSNDTLIILCKIEDLKWNLFFDGGSGVMRYIDVRNNKIYTAEFTDTSNQLVNFLEINENGNQVTIESFDFKKPRRFIYYAQCLTPQNGWQKSTKYAIPLKDSSQIKSGIFEYFQTAPRGADVWSSLYVTNHNGKTVKLEFSHNPATDGYISVHDIVQFNATSFVILYWYYKRFGDSNVQIGFLDLKKYLEK